MKTEEKRMSMSIVDLQAGDKRSNNLASLRVGGRYTVKVTEVVENVLCVVCVGGEADGCTGILSSLHLTQHPALAKAVLSTCQVDDVLKVYCCSTTPQPTFTRHLVITQFYKVI